MKNPHKHLITRAAIAGIVTAALPLLAHAQTTSVPRPAAARQINLDRNRDIRNETMKQRAAPTIATLRTTAPVERLDRTTDVRRTPLWLASSTAPWMKNISNATLKSLQQTATRYASTTAPGGHENWEKARLDLFVWMQSHLLVETQDTLSNLKDLRVRIASRISATSQQGRDMTEAVRLLAIADQKIAAADTAITAIAAITPTFVTASTVSRIDPSTEVSLEGPRETGKAAIRALDDARRALNEVVTAISSAVGSGSDIATTTQQQQ
ncbi:MAG TPA: hypothetical protein VF438_00550 [Candidatus Paceibacterota bacterium]